MRIRAKVGVWVHSPIHVRVDIAVERNGSAYCAYAELVLGLV